MTDQQPTAEEAAKTPGFKSGMVRIDVKDSDYIQRLVKGQGPSTITGKDR